MGMRFLLLILLFATSAGAQTPLHRLLKKQVSGTPFTPTDSSNLLVWYKADGITGLSDGDPISVWPDSSGNGNNLTASGGSRPTWETNLQNGLPGVNFNPASSQFFLLTTPISAATPYTLFIIYKKATAGTSFATFGNGGGLFPATYFDYTDDASYSSPSPSSLLYRTPSGNTSFTLITEVTGLSGYFVWKNGVSQTVTPSAFGTGAGAVFATFGLGITSFFADGQVLEVLLYGHEATSALISNVETYLNNKYGL